MDNNTNASGSSSGTRNTEQPAQNNPSSSSPPAVTNPTGGNFLDELLSYTPGINELPPITPPSSGSGESDSDVPENLLCSICNRRENSVLFVVCGHRACTSCTKRLWNSMRNQPGKPRDPWPISFPCPFCRGVVVSVRDDSRADKQTGARRAGGAGGGEQGMLVAEWILLVSDKAKERLEAEMKGEAPFTDEDFM